MNVSRIALPWTEVNKVLGGLHEGSLGELMEINKFLDKMRE
jgi:hypothetical protein